MLCVSSMTSWCSVKTKTFTKNTWRTPWKKTEQCRHQAEQSREVSVSSAGDWLLGLCHQQRWRESRPKKNRSNPRNAWPYRRCRVTPFSRYGQLPRSLPSESVFSSPASHRTPREGQSVDVGAASGQCCRQSQRDVDFCSNTCLLRSRQGYTSAVYAVQHT